MFFLEKGPEFSSISTKWCSCLPITATAGLDTSGAKPVVKVHAGGSILNFHMVCECLLISKMKTIVDGSLKTSNFWFVLKSRILVFLVKKAAFRSPA